MTVCVALLGGSYDPVHKGHVALGSYFAAQLQVDQLRVIPAGAPWQKEAVTASPEQRAEMVRLAFAGLTVPVVVDCQEIERAAPTYSIDTLRQLRAEFGPQASLVFLMGADQLRRLDTWRDWQQLFDFAHFCVAARAGFALDGPGMPQAVADAFARRLGTLEHIRNTPHGLTYLAQDFAVDISATQIRAALQRGATANSLISPLVLDYIEQHNLYKS
ncbi:nicotinate-nucleotide adenylyltransferase [Janthinobacterium fluminis]|uniref:Probable nicotinate-nucleotide adenylyltransferase n=1 Tax=Janthinobacterium fluminis TaxID=2987524 RepID=A0ABT5K1N7_9BURK|nr:nicotinate-nucleotide adenylyltransferase [Janthinobacterium fluminis]MDC8758903.1 nicotinate-nucleotide adenylyltransferase [Janthinobacterium fluminis]